MLMPSIVIKQQLPLLEPDMEASSAMCNLLILDYDSEDPQPYPGDIQPGIYEDNEIVELLHEHADNQEAIRLIADILEE
jgi:hypothetical protein